MAGTKRDKAGMRNASLSPFQKFSRSFLASILQCLAVCSDRQHGFSRACQDTHCDVLFLRSSFPVGICGGAGAQQVPVPAPPLIPYKSVHRRRLGICVSGLVFRSITEVPSGAHLPIFLKGNYGMKDFHLRALGWTDLRRWHQPSPVRSSHLISLMGTSLSRAPSHR